MQALGGQDRAQDRGRDRPAGSASRLPYPTVVAFERALGLLEAHELGLRVDRAFLVEHGLAANAAGPVVDALRFVGVVDGGGVLRLPARELRTRPSAVARE